MGIATWQFGSRGVRWAGGYHPPGGWGPGSARQGGTPLAALADAMGWPDHLLAALPDDAPTHLAPVTIDLTELCPDPDARLCDGGMHRIDRIQWCDDWAIATAHLRGLTPAGVGIEYAVAVDLSRLP